VLFAQINIISLSHNKQTEPKSQRSHLITQRREDTMVNPTFNQLLLLSLATGSIIWILQSPRPIPSRLTILEILLFFTTITIVPLLAVGVINNDTWLLLAALLAMVCAFVLFVNLAITD